MAWGLESKELGRSLALPILVVGLGTGLLSSVFELQFSCLKNLHFMMMPTILSCGTQINAM